MQMAYYPSYANYQQQPQQAAMTAPAQFMQQQYVAQAPYGTNKTGGSVATSSNNNNNNKQQQKQQNNNNNHAEQNRSIIDQWQAQMAAYQKPNTYQTAQFTAYTPPQYYTMGYTYPAAYTATAVTGDYMNAAYTAQQGYAAPAMSMATTSSPGQGGYHINRTQYFAGPSYSTTSDNDYFATLPPLGNYNQQQQTSHQHYNQQPPLHSSSRAGEAQNTGVEMQRRSRTNSRNDEATTEEEELAPQIEAAYAEAAGGTTRRAPIHKRQVITVPASGPTRVQQVVRRLSTPTPDVVERVFIMKPQRDVVNLVIERPGTPPVQFKDRTVYGKQRRPIIAPRIVRVAARSSYAQYTPAQAYANAAMYQTSLQQYNDQYSNQQYNMQALTAPPLASSTGAAPNYNYQNNNAATMSTSPQQFQAQISQAQISQAQFSQAQFSQAQFSQGVTSSRSQLGGERRRSRSGRSSSASSAGSLVTSKLATLSLNKQAQQQQQSAPSKPRGYVIAPVQYGIGNTAASCAPPAYYNATGYTTAGFDYMAPGAYGYRF